MSIDSHLVFVADVVAYRPQSSFIFRVCGSAGACAHAQKSTKLTGQFLLPALL